MPHCKEITKQVWASEAKFQDFLVKLRKCGDICKHFLITTPPKTQEHPWFNHITATEDAFAVQKGDGKTVQGKILHLKRGKRYWFTFKQADLPEIEHLLFFTNDPTGGPAGGDRVCEPLEFDPPDYDPPRLPGTPDPFGEFATVSFCIGDSLPSLFYYQCKVHEFMGGIILVKD
jgi:hypothetical protein